MQGVKAKQDKGPTASPNTVIDVRDINAKSAFAEQPAAIFGGALMRPGED
jgi:hypothetical protein